MSVLMSCLIFLLQFLVGEMLHHEGGKLTVQIAEENDVAFSHLVEHAHQVSLAVGIFPSVVSMVEMFEM